MASYLNKYFSHFLTKYMILHIVKHEMLRSYREGRAATIVITVGLMLFFSIGLSVSNYKLSQDQYTENVRQSRLNWDNQTEKDPHDAAHDGTYVIKPLHPLSMLDKGIQEYSGQVVHLGAHQRKQSTLNEAKDHSGMFRFGSMTPHFVLLYVLPLLLIFIAHDVFTQERASKRIQILLAQGVSFRKLATGKWIALVIQLSFLIALFFLITLLGYVLIERPTFKYMIELACLIVAYFFYLVVFLNLSVFVSAKARSSRQSLTFLLGIWIVTTLIVPRLSTNFAASIYPFPTLQTFRDNINTDQVNGLNGHNFWNEAAQDFQQKVLDEYGVETIEDLPIAYSGLLLAEGEKYESEIYTKHFNLLRSQYQKQQDIYRLSGAVSPFLSVRFISMAIARSDYGFQWRFEDQAEKYRVELNTALNMNIAENSKGVQNYQADSNLWSSMPQFEYQWQSSGEILKDHLKECLILLIWVSASFLLMIYYGSKREVV